jgi:hypothetical protein
LIGVSKLVRVASGSINRPIDTGVIGGSTGEASSNEWLCGVENANGRVEMPSGDPWALATTAPECFMSSATLSEDACTRCMPPFCADFIHTPLHKTIVAIGRTK